MSRDTRDFERRAAQGRMAVVKGFEAINTTAPRSFNSNDGICVKCGNTQHQFQICSPEERCNSLCEVDGEHLHRLCAACQYDWVERTREHSLAFAEHGQHVIEGEAAAVIAAVAKHQGGIRLPIDLLKTYMGWTLHFRRDFENGTLVIDAVKPEDVEEEVP